MAPTMVGRWMTSRNAARFALAALLAVLPSLAGCPVPQNQNTPVWQRMEVNPGTGTAYWLYVPSTYRQDRPAPLIISCHGTPPWDVCEHHVREWKDLGEQHGCIIIAPELQATDGLIGDGPISGMLECERRILTIISQLGYRYNVDRANIMITGFSGGGFPTYWVGLRHPEVFSVVVARNCNFSRGNVDGWYTPEAQKSAIKVYYGSNDPFPIILQSRDAVQYLREQGFNVESEVLPGKGHQRQPEVAMNFFLRNMKPPRPSAPRNKAATDTDDVP